MAISRREALQLSGLFVATAAVSGYSDEERKKANNTPKTKSANAPIANAKGPRVVVVGGGWSGLSIAKYRSEEHSLNSSHRSLSRMPSSA